jgi:alanine racemase
MIESFLAKEWTPGRIDPSAVFERSAEPLLLHGHCQQKAVIDTAASRALLEWVAEEVREVDAGCCGMAGSFGYGTAFQAPRDMVVGVLPVGYSDGYPRALSNRGHVLVRGREAPVVGLVNMNVTMVDVTDVPGVDVGDEVVLVGRQGRRSISVASFSEVASALNNEFVSRLPAAIPRTAVR